MATCMAPSHLGAGWAPSHHAIMLANKFALLVATNLPFWVCGPPPMLQCFWVAILTTAALSLFGQKHRDHQRRKHQLAMLILPVLCKHLSVPRSLLTIPPCCNIPTLGQTQGKVCPRFQSHDERVRRHSSSHHVHVSSRRRKCSEWKPFPRTRHIIPPRPFRRGMY